MAERTSPSSTSVSYKRVTNRPPILKKTSHSPSIPSSASLLGSPRREKSTVLVQDRDMSACFLQYCAMCERQITTPCNSLLYCSESCKHKDSMKPLSASNLTGTFSSASAPTSPRSVPIPRSLTASSSPTTCNPETTIPSDNHGFKTDLDPTEWKPKSRGASVTRDRYGRPMASRYTSEAHRYLSTFHRAISKKEDGEISFEVPSVTASSVPTPDLSTSPGTTASSWGASIATPGMNPAGAGAGVMAMASTVGGEGYDFKTRPLVVRHNRWYSSSSVSTGFDLVTPHIPPSTMGDVSFERKPILVGGMPGKSGLGAFFGGVED